MTFFHGDGVTAVVTDEGRHQIRESGESVLGVKGIAQGGHHGRE